MSTFNRNTLAIALAVAVTAAFSTSAMASGVVTPAGTADQHSFAHEVTGGTTPNPTAWVEGKIDYTLVPADILIGRTNTSGDITVTGTVAGGTVTAAPTITIAPGQGTLNAITFSGNTFQFTITPPAAPGMVAGPLFSVAAGSLKLSSATGVTPSGSGITLAVVIQDTNTAIVLNSSPATAVLSGIKGTTTVISAMSTSVIDVNSPANKTTFTPSGTSAATLGSVTFGRADGIPATVAIDPVSALGTGAVGNSSPPDFQFAVAADTGKLTLTVPNNSAFTGTGGFWATTAPCTGTKPANGPTAQNFVVAVGDPTTYTATVAINTPAGQTYNICALANGTAIGAQTITLTAQIDIGSVLGRDPAAVTAPLALLRYNGSVVDFYHVNPAGNTTAQSFLRIINPSSVSGKVTLIGIDDNGAPAPGGAITFTLGAGKSMQINSADLEAGNAGKGLSGAWGDGAGKWRGTATGEFANMLLQSLNRNQTDGTVTNLTDADNRGEQVINSILNDN